MDAYRVGEYGIVVIIAVLCSFVGAEWFFGWQFSPEKLIWWSIVWGTASFLAWCFIAGGWYDEASEKMGLPALCFTLCLPAIFVAVAAALIVLFIWAGVASLIDSIQKEPATT